jgi:hypothetical protein
MRIGITTNRVIITLIITTIKPFLDMRILFFDNIAFLFIVIAFLDLVILKKEKKKK